MNPGFLGETIYRRGALPVLRGALYLFLLWASAAQAAVVFQAAGTALASTGAVSPAWPAHLVGDVALLFVESTGGQPVTLSNAAGFAAVSNSPQSTGTGTAGTRLTVFWARATSTSMAAPTVADPGNHVYAQIITYRGAVTSGNPWDVTGGGVKASASGTVSVTGITTTVANTLVVQAVSRDNDRSGAEFSAETNAALSGIAERADGGTAQGNGGGFAVWDGTKTTAGATGNTTATISRSTLNAFLSIALSPDVTPPTVLSIARANPDPTGAASVQWTVTFSEGVTGVDSGDFSLAQAGGLSGATIASVTGSGTTWTVTANTGSGSGTLGLNLNDNDTILDLGSNKLGGTGTGVAGGGGAGNGSFTGAVYTIDRGNPFVSSIVRLDGDPTAAASVRWSVTFSESVTGVDATDFQLAVSGLGGSPAITGVSGSGTTYTVTASTGSGSGTLGLNLNDDDSIQDASNNKLGGTGTGVAGGGGAGNGSYTGELYTFDRIAPAVASISCGADSSLLTATVTFSESVTGVDTGDFALAQSGLSGAYIASVAGSGTTWTVVANTGICSGTCTLGVNLVDDDSIVDAAGNKLGGAGAGNGSFTGQVCSIVTTPADSYSMDEASWNGTAGEVTDSDGSSPGAAVNNATTIVGDTGTCRYGVFDNGGTITKGAVQLPDLGIDLTSDVTIAAWIRTTDNTKTQTIFADDNNTTNSYSLSVAGTGKLRFYVKGATVENLDTAAGVISSNTWYYVAGVADIANGQRTIYVYKADGTLAASATTAVTGPASPIGPPGTPTISAPTTADHFRGNIDELRIYDKVLQQSALATLAATTHACATAGPNHYELSLPTSAISCLPVTATVTACADNSSPCTNPYTAASGTTATLATSAGTLGTATVTFNASGVASTTLSYPAATDGASASVTLSGEQVPAGALRQCCPNGISCVAANSCSTTFNTAGFIFSTSAGGGVAAISAQVAGTSSATHYLRAVKTGSTTMACQAALTGAQSVDLGYECNNPTSCSGSNLMSVNGGSATTIARNNNGSVSSYTPVNMTFDANGNAPLTFNYSDVGQVRLWASKSASGSLLTPLTGSSNAFVVAPANFLVTASGPYVAGTAFTAMATARTSTGATAPNFGRESVPETVELQAVTTAAASATNSQLASPTGAGVALGTLTPGTFTLAKCSPASAGSVCETALAWTEVGDLVLSAALKSGSYLGSGLSAWGSAAAGPFRPAYFDTIVTSGCGGAFTYAGLSGGSPLNGQPFTVLVKAKRAGGDLTDATNTANYAGATWAKAVTLSDAGGGSGTLVNGSFVATDFANGKASRSDVFYQFATKNTPPYTLVIRAVDADTPAVSSSGHTEGSTTMRSGRVRLSNAYGSELLGLPVPTAIEYYESAANGWRPSAGDTCTALVAANFAFAFGGTGNNLGACETAVAVGGAAPAPTVTLARPGGGNNGWTDLTLNLGAAATGNRCTAVGAAGPAATAANLPWLQSIWSGGVPGNPTARATFGVYKTPVIYRRENY